MLKTTFQLTSRFFNVIIKKYYIFFIKELIFLHIDVFVKRPNDLIEARFSLSAKQNDIIDLLLSKLENNNTIEYELNLSDYKIFFNRDNTNIYRDFKKAVEEFGKNGSFKINNYSEKIDKAEFFWFVAIYYISKEAKIIFKLDKDVKALLLQMKNVTYYKIKYTLNFTSIYSKRMYLYLKRFEDTGIRIDKVEDLISKMKCPQTYLKKYTDFKKRVLVISQKEINDNTDIKFTYEEKKTGRKITHLVFHIIRVAEEKPEEQIIDNKEEIKTIPEIDVFELIEELEDIISEPIKTKDLKKILKAANNDIELIKEKYKAAKKQGGIENLVGWLISAINNNYSVSEPIALEKEKIKKPYIKPNRFINYEQRNWDFEEMRKLERKLLDREVGEIEN